MDKGSRGTRLGIWREEVSPLGRVFLSTVVHHGYWEVPLIWVPLQAEQFYAPLQGLGAHLVYASLEAFPAYVSPKEKLVFLPDILFPDRLFSQWSQKMSLVLSSE